MTAKPYRDWRQNHIFFFTSFFWIYKFYIKFAYVMYKFSLLIDPFIGMAHYYNDLQQER